LLKISGIIILLVVIFATSTTTIFFVHGQDQRQYYQEQWKQEQSKKQFDENNYVIGGMGSRTCPDVEDKHGILFVKYPTGDPIYEQGCSGQVAFYKYIQDYEVISVDESDITGITTVKLTK